MPISRPATDSRRTSIPFASMLLALMCSLAAATSHAELLYVSMGSSGTNTPRILAYDISLGSSGAVQGSVQTFASGTTNLNTPYGMTFDASGNLYVVNTAVSSAPYVSIFDSSGSYQSRILQQGVLGTPIDVQIDSSNRVWVSNSGANTISLFLNGTSQGGITGNMNQPLGLAITSASNFLYVANFANSTISKFNIPAGTLAQTIPNTNLNGPYGLALDQTGNLYATNYSANTVSKFDSSGSFLSTIGSATNLAGPDDVTFDTAGNMYVANLNTSTISKFDSAGTFQFSWSTPLAPQGLAVAPVPEPGTLALAAIAGLAAARCRPRRRQRSAPN